MSEITETEDCHETNSEKPVLFEFALNESGNFFDRSVGEHASDDIEEKNANETAATNANETVVISANGTDAINANDSRDNDSNNGDRFIVTEAAPGGENSYHENDANDTYSQSEKFNVENYSTNMTNQNHIVQIVDESPPPRFFDIGVGSVFRLSNWIRQDQGTLTGGAHVEQTAASDWSIKTNRFSPGSTLAAAKRRQPMVFQEDEWVAGGTSEIKRPASSALKHHQSTLHDYFEEKSDEYEREVLQKRNRSSEKNVADYEEHARQERSSPPRSYNQSVYKSAARPAQVLTELYGRSARTLGGVVRHNFKIPVGEAAIVRRQSFNNDESLNNLHSKSSAVAEDPSTLVAIKRYDSQDHMQSQSRADLPVFNIAGSTVPSDMDPNLVGLIEREILQLKSEVTWDDLIGLSKEKANIKEMVVWPLLRPDLFKGIRAPPKGLLLYGPPGTGKTLIGRCVASQAKATFFNVSASSLTSKWMGESEKLVRTLFEVARLKAPAVIFIDEVDSLMSQRLENEHDSTRRMKNEFLQQLDGAKSGIDEQILLIGATNRPHELDAAARRRFSRRIYVPLPDFEARGQIIANLLAEQNHNLTGEQIQRLGNVTDGYSCADITHLCKEAALGPLRSLENIETVSLDEIPSITYEHFEKALATVRSTISEKDLASLKNFHETFGYNG